MPARSEGVAVVSTVVRGVAGAARGAAAATGSVARHTVWYLRYRVDGNRRAQSRRERRSGERR